MACAETSLELRQGSSAPPVAFVAFALDSATGTYQVSLKRVTPPLSTHVVLCHVQLASVAFSITSRPAPKLPSRNADQSGCGARHPSPYGPS